MQFHRRINNWECGIRAIQNALTALGIESNRETIKIYTGCTRSSGTSARGMIRGITQYGCKPSKYQTRDPDLAWRWITRWASRTPCIVLLDDWNHWSVIAGSVADRVILIDSERGSEDLIGASPLTKQELLARWVGRGVYYAIRVTRA